MLAKPCNMTHEQLRGTWGTLDSRIVVHSYASIQMWTRWTLGLWSIAHTNTNKQEFWIIQTYEFFNYQVANSSITVPMAREMLKRLCSVQHGPYHFFSKPVMKIGQH